MNGSRGSAFVTLTVLAFTSCAMAQTTPPPCCPGPECPSGKTIRIVVPFAPGGPTDAIARQLAQDLRASVGNGEYIVENRTGAGGVVGAAAVAKADWRDTILVSNAQLAVNTALLPSVPYTLGRDLIPVAGIASSPVAIAVPTGKTFNSLQQLIASAKNNPGRLSVGTSGTGSIGHLALEQLSQATGAKVTHIPYKGAGPATADLVGNQLDAAVLSLASIRPHVQSGKVRVLAVFSEQRLSANPEVPTVKDATQAAVSAEDWIGVFAAGNTPPECTKSLGRRLNRITESPQFRGNLERFSLAPATRDPELFASQVRADVQRYAKTAKDAGVKLD